MLDKTLTLILAGGQGSRLRPLTDERAKPAVPFGGKYRIIDFALTNCLHSGLRRVLVLTQYKSHSLQKHLRDGWSLFNPELGEYVTPVPPQMRTGESWYGGTADAVFQNLYLIKRSGARWVLIVSGDHIYRMDYAALLEFHRSHGAGLTIACMDAAGEQEDRYGMLNVDTDGTARDFHIEPVITGSGASDAAPAALASMGIYVFSIDLLLQALEEDHNRQSSSHDLASDLIPELVAKQDVRTYLFGGKSGRVTVDRYWRDVGTLDSFYEANMDLLNPKPSLDLYQPDWPIRTYQAQFPPVRTVPGVRGSEGIFINSIAGGGVLIVGGSVQHSILFPQVYVGDEGVVHESLLFRGVRVGDGAELQRCIVDKEVEIPAGEQIGFDKARDAERFTVTQKGVVVVPRGYEFDR